MIDEMIGTSESVKIKSCGGTEDGRLGTNSLEILKCIEQFKEAEYILIFSDIGSAVLSAETALDLIEAETLKTKIQLVDAPLVEGAFAAAVRASINSSLNEILVEVANC
ncbi:dihydroxyacetone kinase phosphoryl donor subunit DhaM [Marinilactibacillus sp. 15R]|nr:dihydroxyacetone kinase phosphoryl donor subunit DhaM [Marinilactibacillus sp. 15R]